MGLFNYFPTFEGGGKTDDFERARRVRAAMEMLESERNEELIAAGLDPDELAEMDCYERREVLEDAGFDPDEYGF